MPRSQTPRRRSRRRLGGGKGEQRQGDPPLHPIGPHFIDIGVKVVVPNRPVVILQGAASGAKHITVEPHQLFPIVEGFFGPLRVPLPRTSAVLDAEYGDQWRTKNAVKTCSGKYTRILNQHCRRAIHPAVPLKGRPRIWDVSRVLLATAALRTSFGDGCDLRQPAALFVT